MEDHQHLDHLFRHQYGKMVSVLTRIFGLTHLEMIEDAVQDTFVRAMVSWRQHMPEKPEAWLMTAAKNRAVDLLRQLTAAQKRLPNLPSGPAAITVNELFLEDEIADSQLRMIFTACHPALKAPDQIAFALKTISGFSHKEIASALLLKEETIKKRLQRARKFIRDESVAFRIPTGAALPQRLDRVMEVLYLIFNEGFHSNQTKGLIRKELCGEALRLCQMLVRQSQTQSPKVYALFALMCFHAARLDSKINEAGEIVDLQHQDRQLWHIPLINLGHNMMYKAVQDNVFSSYHYEAAIAAEHLLARSFADTNWNKIFHWYEQLYTLHHSPITLLNMAMVRLQQQQLEQVTELLEMIDPAELEQRAYLYYGAYAEYFHQNGEVSQAISYLDKALALVKNTSEREYLEKKRDSFHLP